jgi:hypothetical protein
VIKVKGQGHNALDFFIAYYLGIYVKQRYDAKYYIFSNDQGFDPLIQHIKESGIFIERKSVLINEKKDEVIKQTKNKKESENYIKAKKAIDRIPIKNRPKMIKSLIAKLINDLGKGISESDVLEIFEELKREGEIQVVENKVKYKK